MALKITCPHCGRKHELDEPYPLPGTERQCACGRTLSISYPMGMMEKLRSGGKRFAAEAGADRVPAPAPAASVPVPSARVAVPVDRPPVPVERAPAAEGTVPVPHLSQRARAATLIPDAPMALERPTESLRPTQLERPGGERTEQLNREAIEDYGVPESVSDPAMDSRGTQARTAVGPAVARIVVPAAVPPKPAAATVGGTKPPPQKPSVARAKKAVWRGWLVRLAGGGSVVGLIALLAGLGVAYGGFRYFSKDLPTVETLGKYRPPTVSVVHDKKGRLLGEIYDERRYVVPLDRIPLHVQNAFLSAEDAGFYAHDGVDYWGIVRAVLRNAAAGKKAQGASTITQQVTRNFLLTNEKTYTRKIREVLLAWRIEDTFDKQHILYLYLNQIYLGSHAYGVEAAARVYFGKHVEELSLAEAAMIAGLPQRPSDYSPHRHFDKAKGRQKYVLGQMVENGYITQAESDAAFAEPVKIVEKTNEFLTIAPWVTETVRIHLVEQFGAERVLHDGLTVETSVDLDLQQLAQTAVTNGVTSVDNKRGWRGADVHLDAAAIPSKLAELAKADPGAVEGERYDGVVTDVKKGHAIVDIGGPQVIIPLAWTEWAYKPDASRNSNYRKQDDLSHALVVGDVVRVEVQNHAFRDAKPLKDYKLAGEGPYAAATLYQSPDLEGALYSYSVDDGGILAMIGGVDYRETKFNRATQAQRQVGSTFKPIVYAAAIESKKFTAGTILQDAPLIFNSLHHEVWKPENYDSDYLGDITLRRALAMSRNVCTIRVLDQLGIDPVYQMAQRLGVTSHLDADLSMGLGSASLTLPEITRAYSAFASGGLLVEPHLINKVTDRDGVVLEQFTKPDAWKRVLDPGVASVANWLLQEVASNGTAARAQQLGLHVGGKTGTTNEFHDAWFVGFTHDTVTSVWVGYDQPRSIGESSTGGHISLPIWMQYTKAAQPKATDKPFALSGGLHWVSIDEKTGRPMEGGRSMPFLPGTGPTGAATVAGQQTTEDLLTTEF
jgi:penicillin-binding protein 1A